MKFNRRVLPGVAGCVKHVRSFRVTFTIHVLIKLVAYGKYEAVQRIMSSDDAVVEQYCCNEGGVDKGV